MRISLPILICLGLATALLADPDHTFKMIGVAGGNQWIDVRGEHDLKLGESLTLVAPKNSVCLIRSNPEKVKPTEWFTYGAELTSDNPQAGIVFNYVNEKNFARFILRGKEAFVTELKDGIETVIVSASLGDLAGPPWNLHLEIRQSLPVSLRVNNKYLFEEHYKARKEVLATSLGKMTYREKTGLGLICESGSCTFKTIAAHGMAKF